MKLQELALIRFGGHLPKRALDIDTRSASWWAPLWRAHEFSRIKIALMIPPNEMEEIL